MSVQITKISQDVFEVNGKTMSKDMEGNWIASEELTTQELKFFREHLKSNHC
jgi:hypothetical protein